LAPDLGAAVATRVKSTRLVGAALHQLKWVRDITGYLSVSALTKYLELWSRVQPIRLTQNLADRFI
jgi:hypothetical protein